MSYKSEICLQSGHHLCSRLRGHSKQGPRSKPRKNFSGSLDLKPANAIIRLVHHCFLWTSEFQRGKNTSRGTHSAAKRTQKSTRTSLLSTGGRWGYPGKEPEPQEPLGAHFHPSPSGRSRRQHRWGCGAVPWASTKLPEPPGAELREGEPGTQIHSNHPPANVAHSSKA